MLGSEILRVIPAVNTTGSMLKVEDTTLTNMRTKPVVSKSRIKSNFKSKHISEFISNREKIRLKPLLQKYLKNQIGCDNRCQ